VEQATDQVAQLIAADRGVTLSSRAQVSRPPPSNVGSPGLIGLLFLLGIVVVFLYVIAKVTGGGPRRGGGFWMGGPGLGGGGFTGGFGGGGFGGSSGGFSGGFGGFGGGSSGGGGAEGSW
jgi:uncharacterized protein